MFWALQARGRFLLHRVVSLSLFVEEDVGGAFPQLESVPILECHGLVHHVGREVVLDSLSCFGGGMS
jgi:hypothetical protein